MNSDLNNPFVPPLDLKTLIADIRNYLSVFKMSSITVDHHPGSYPNPNILLFTFYYPDLTDQSEIKVPLEIVQDTLKSAGYVVSEASSKVHRVITRLLNQEFPTLNSALRLFNTEITTPNTITLLTQDPKNNNRSIVVLNLITRLITLRSMSPDNHTEIAYTYPPDNTIKSLATHILTAINQYERISSL